MPELSRRLKRQRFWDDHAEAIGNTLMYLAFTAFLLGLIWAVVTNGSLRWAWWLFVPVVIGAVISASADETHIPEEHSLSTPSGPPRSWRRRRRP
jgi:amino acid transporter